MALGMAKASGRPVAVTCTSGTAAANLAPAVHEAWQARVPLIVLTADRPPELREVGAGQAIDQIQLYGSAAKWFVEVGNHEPARATAEHFRGAGLPRVLDGRRRAARAGAPELPAARAAGPAPGGAGRRRLGRPRRRPAVDASCASTRPRPTPTTCSGWPRGWPSAPRGAIVCGPSADDVAEPVARLAAAERLAGAGRAHVRRALRRARPLARGGRLRRAPARRGLRRRARARPRAARGRHAHLQAAARVAGRRAAGGGRPPRRLARAHPHAPSWCCTPSPPPPATRWPPRWRCARAPTDRRLARGVAQRRLPGGARPRGGARAQRAAGLRGGRRARSRPARSCGRPPRCRCATWRRSGPRARADALPRQPRRERDRRHDRLGRGRRARHRRSRRSC